ncbi:MULTISPECIES: hypothetical protein [Achromobacter]|jgi:hypothetical protein|uniref:hypothetical protein n=1 Tax=Achromobacter TaxID=222 RepID=UPI0005D820D7|nr:MULTISPECIES: hypothetical protein [Achromobacter]ELQ7838795.1 hypothetical protein [Pseudomonas aeruginosa]MDH0519516.1 hypothetical protein [Achromobacter xylosoxidans]MDH0543662.1 hypothetical protein [Achromobacter xylosoxidans]MDQ6211513.1 hypothetical protein [Achromobacter insolitus]QKQ54415.1 hypothetical protein FOC83_16385 [Achromobacter xylosoxidans]
MLIDIPDALYAAAVNNRGKHFSRPEQLLAYWSALGKSCIENPNVSPTLISQLLLSQMTEQSDLSWHTRTLNGERLVAESEAYRCEVMTLPEEARAVCERALQQLASHPGAGIRLFGELSCFSLFQWAEYGQLVQIGYVRGGKRVEILLAGLCRQYVGV